MTQPHNESHTQWHRQRYTRFVEYPCHRNDVVLGPSGESKCRISMKYHPIHIVNNNRASFRFFFCLPSRTWRSSILSRSAHCADTFINVDVAVIGVGIGPSLCICVLSTNVLDPERLRMCDYIVSVVEPVNPFNQTLFKSGVATTPQIGIFRPTQFRRTTQLSTHGWGSV